MIFSWKSEEEKNSFSPWWVRSKSNLDREKRFVGISISCDWNLCRYLKECFSVHFDAPLIESAQYNLLYSIYIKQVCSEYWERGGLCGKLFFFLRKDDLWGPLTCRCWWAYAAGPHRHRPQSLWPADHFWRRGNPAGFPAVLSPAWPGLGSPGTDDVTKNRKH